MPRQPKSFPLELLNLRGFTYTQATTSIDRSINFSRNDRNANKNKRPASTDNDVNRPEAWLKHNSFHLARIKSWLCVSSSVPFRAWLCRFPINLPSVLDKDPDCIRTYICPSHISLSSVCSAAVVPRRRGCKHSFSSEFLTIKWS